MTLTKGHVRQAPETILNNNLVFQFSECLESAQPHDKMLNMSNINTKYEFLVITCSLPLPKQLVLYKQILMALSHSVDISEIEKYFQI